MIFAENLNLKAMSRGMLCKHTLDAAFGRSVAGGSSRAQTSLQFLGILGWVAWKRDVYFALGRLSQYVSDLPDVRYPYAERFECQNSFLPRSESGKQSYTANSLLNVVIQQTAM